MIREGAINRADNGTKWCNLPKDFPPWQTGYGYFRLWVALRGMGSGQ